MLYPRLTLTLHWAGLLGSSIASSSLERGTALNEELLELKRRVLSYQQARDSRDGLQHSGCSLAWSIHQ